MNYKIIKTYSIDSTKVNTTIDCGGRFGNTFIRNFVAEYFAKKNNLKMKYECNDMFKKLGIELFSGNDIYDETIIIDDKNLDSLMFNDNVFNSYALHKNIFFKQCNYNPFSQSDCAWCQTSSVVSYIRNYVNADNRCFLKNPYKDRYNNNNDLFIHVRLGDAFGFKFHSPFEYYDTTIPKIPYDKAYITSDSIEHDICQRLIKKYNLIVFNSDEIDTLQFGSTCKSLILSSGTFSWLLGLLGFCSNVHYPDIRVKWHGNIFVYPDWHKMGY